MVCGLSWVGVQAALYSMTLKEISPCTESSSDGCRASQHLVIVSKVSKQTEAQFRARFAEVHVCMPRLQIMLCHFTSPPQRQPGKSFQTHHHCWEQRPGQPEKRGARLLRRITTASEYIAEAQEPANREVIALYTTLVGELHQTAMIHSLELQMGQQVQVGVNHHARVPKIR